MPDVNFILLYVRDPRISAAFWADLLGRPPVEQSDTFALLPLREGVMLGLWKRDGVVPAAAAGGGGGEIAMAVGGVDVVEALHAAWAGRGITIVQTPEAMDFGTTFTAVDPDGHRIRVFCPAG